MNNPVKIAVLSLCIPLFMLFVHVDHKVCLAVTVLALAVCWYAYTKYDNGGESENTDEDANNNNNITAGRYSPAKNIYADMGTKDLCLQLLQKMNVDVRKDEDDEDSFIFEYKGETMSFRASNDGRFILMYDTFWKKFPATNLEMVTLARKTVNRANIEYNGFKLLYTFADDTMWIHSNNFFLLVPEIPHVEEYFKSSLDNFLYAHKAFDDAMYELMKEEGESNKSEE